MRSDRTRIGKWVRVVAALTLGLSMFSAQPAQAAITKIPSNVSVVYLTGTLDTENKSCVTIDTVGHSLEVKWLHRRLVNELRIDPSKSFSLNYYCPQGARATLTKKAELPAVAPVTEMVAVTAAGKPVAGCLSAASTYVESGQPDTGKTKNQLPEPVIRHAYHVAWWLHKQVQDNPGRQFLLIGHSQGGILMRLIYLLSEQSRRAAITGTNWLEGRYNPRCWPNFPKTMFYGNIFMGTPFLGGIGSIFSCGLRLAGYELCDILNTRNPSVTRRILDKYKALVGPSPARQIQFGGNPEEHVVAIFKISGESTTALPGGRAFLIQKSDRSQMRHEDWFNTNRYTAGQCPASSVVSPGFCVYFDVTGQSYGGSAAGRIRISDETECSGCPGNAYDLIVWTIKKWWS